jgi:hypothetical protein
MEQTERSSRGNVTTLFRRPGVHTHKHVASYTTFQFRFKFDLRTMLPEDKGRGISGALKSTILLCITKRKHRGRERLFFKPTTRSLCRLLPRGRWEDNIKMDLRDTE